MKRSEIFYSLSCIQFLIDDSEVLGSLISAIRAMSQSEKVAERTKMKVEAQQEAINTMSTIFAIAPSFDSNIRETLNILDLEPMMDKDFWTSVVTGQIDVNVLRAFYRNVQAVNKLIPNILVLLKNDLLHFIDQDDHNLSSKFYDQDVLHVSIIEKGAFFSKPERLSDVLKSVSEIYEVCSVILEVRDEPISVIACDSGSDKSFDFLGAARVIEFMRGIFVDIWDRVVFYRENKQERRPEIIAKSLPILEQISQLEEKLGKEEVMRIRLKSIDSLTRFVSAGAITNEMQQKTKFEPRRLIVPEKKYLVPPAEESTDSQESTELFDGCELIDGIDDDNKEERN